MESSTNYEDKILRVFPYRNTGFQVLFFSFLFIPASFFIMYAPFRNPCSFDRTSGDCSLGSLFMEQLYTVFMVCLGVSSLIWCLFIIRRFNISRIPHRGRRVAFTEDSIIGPIWGTWSSPEGEIKFYEISNLSVVQTKYSFLLQVETLSQKKMLLQRTFLLEEDYFREIFNHLAHALKRPTFDETVTPEMAKAFIPIKEQISEMAHLGSAFLYFAICGSLTLIFGSSSNQETADGVYKMGLLIPLVGFVYILTRFYKEVWASNLARIVSFIFLMVFGLFLGFIGVVGLLNSL